MYLKKLELLGFKSFAEKTVLNFEPGVAAVVGPNGCGKSNIFDSVRWVLGEQSVKAMRGSSMEDVIFNGTDERAGLGFAEVSLTFSNESKMLPIAFDEVTVSRRLFRSGDSEYLLNKTQVRLRDILELFMGTGIGAESYSLIEQGKIDMILSSRPEDRRMIFDEAAGITKYKSKKREAVNKLQDTENNLLRVNDIITEVRRQINSIERQAAKARRYKEKFEELKNLEVKLAKFQLDEFRSKKTDFSKLIEKLQEEERITEEKIAQSNNKLNEYNQKIEELQNSINEFKTQDLKFDNLIEKNTHHIQLNNERINEMSLQRERFTEQKAQLENRISAQKGKIEEFKAQLSSLESLDKQKNDSLQEKSTSLGEIAKTIKKAQEIIAKSKMKILDVSSNQSKIKNEIIEINTQIQTRLARKRRLGMEKSKVLTEKDGVQSNLDKLLEKIELIERDLGQLHSQRDATACEISNLGERVNAIGRKIKELQDKKLSLESQREFIAELKLKYEDMPGQMKAVFLADQKPINGSTGIIGKVSAVDDVKIKDSSILEGFSPGGNSGKFYRLICEAKYISLDPAQITKKIDELASQIQDLKQQEVLIRRAIESKEKKLIQIEENIHQKEIILSNEGTQKKAIEDELGKLKDEIDLVEVELSELNEKLTELQKKVDELSKQSNQIEQESQNLNQLISDNQKTISSKIDEREQTTVAIAQLKTEIDSIKDKKNAQHDTLSMLETALKDDYSESSLLEQEDKNSIKKAAELETELVNLKDEIQKIKVQKEALSKDLKEFYSRNENVISLVEEERQKLGVLESEHERIKKDSHDSQMSEQEINYKEQSIKDRISQTYKLNLDEVQTEKVGAVNVENLSDEIIKLKEKLDSFGTVNLVAIEEYEELKKRYEFLTNQHNDLLSAKDAINKTITKINRTTRVMFLETFEKIGTEFHTYFRLLFGGGDARLILIEPDDVLESGIEIVARPPGKKLQSIDLLSGGEKALTAIALIFGVFRVKPSPFCILDEIDAALDESNIGRFAHTLREFAKKSQFIVITHNKKTIVNADVMYGITMAETGISKIVSVKFGEKENKTTAMAGAV